VSARPSFRHALAVRYADTDAQGVVFFANYLTYADEGLTYWMQHLGLPHAVFTDQGLDFVFVDAHVQYRDSARFGDTVHVHVGPERIGTTSLTSRFVIVRASDDAVLAEGQLVQVCLSLPARTPHPLPDALRAALA
jgi:acyl-CoA thioester hydrolase